MSEVCKHGNPAGPQYACEACCEDAITIRTKRKTAPLESSLAAAQVDLKGYRDLLEVKQKEISKLKEENARFEKAYADLTVEYEKELRNLITAESKLKIAVRHRRREGEEVNESMSILEWIGNQVTHNDAALALDQLGKKLDRVIRIDELFEEIETSMNDPVRNKLKALEAENARYKAALEKIKDYKKKTDREDDYQTTLSIQAIAQDAVDPCELVCSEALEKEKK